MNLQQEMSTFKSKDVLAMPYWRKHFDHKSVKDWVVVGIMSIPLVVLSIFGAMFLIQLYSLPG